MAKLLTLSREGTGGPADACPETLSLGRVEAHSAFKILKVLTHSDIGYSDSIFGGPSLRTVTELRRYFYSVLAHAVNDEERK